MSRRRRKSKGPAPRADASPSSSDETSKKTEETSEIAPPDPTVVRVWPLGVIIAIQFSVIWMFYTFADGNAPAPRLIALDALALPGEEIELVVYVDQDLPPLLCVDEEVTVTLAGLDGADSSTVAATRNGRATFRVPAPAEPGTHRLRVRASLPDPNEPLEAWVVVHVIAPTDKIILTTVRGTLWSGLPDARNPADGDPTPRKDASEALTKLAADHAIVYIGTLPRRDLHGGKLSPGFREWLARHGFPEGAILFPSISDDDREVSSGPRVEQLKKLLDEELGRWPQQVERAFGSPFDDVGIEAFSGAGIKATISIGAVPDASGKLPGVISAQNWKKAADIIRRQ